MATFIKISTITVGAGGAASIDFTSIPATYTDLKIVLSSRATASSGNWETIGLTINGVTTGQTWKRLFAYNSAVIVSDSSAGLLVTDGSGATASTFASTEIYIPNYASANYKSISADGATETNGTGSLLGLTAFLWSNTAAITSISLANDTSNFAQYSSATLYGIKSS